MQVRFFYFSFNTVSSFSVFQEGTSPSIDLHDSEQR